MPKIMPVKQPMLISKMQNISISAFGSVVDKNSSICIPKSARTFDLVKVINKCGNPVDIITFRKKVSDNSIGAVVRRYFVEQLPLSKRVTQKDYKYKPTESYSKNEIMNRQVKTKIVQGQAEPEYENETQVVMCDGDKSHLYIKKIKTSKCLPSFDREIQSLYRYQKGEKRKGYEIGPYLRTKNHYFEPTPFIYHFERFNEESKERMIQDRYLPLHLYSFDEFKKIAPSVASHPDHIAKYPCEIAWTDKLAPKMYGHMVADLSNNKKTIYLNKKLNNNHYQVINSSAHEQEHAYECEQIYNLMIHDTVVEEYVLEPTQKNLQRFERAQRFFPVDSIEKAEEYKNDYRCYIKFEDNSGDYYSQHAETRARVAGVKAVKSYFDSVQRLKSEFPDAPDGFFGMTLAEEQESLECRNIMQEILDRNI